jgi:hypothetical protein
MVLIANGDGLVEQIDFSAFVKIFQQFPSLHPSFAETTLLLCGQGSCHKMLLLVHL